MRLIRDIFDMSCRLVWRNFRRYKSIVAAIGAGGASLILLVCLGDSIELRMAEHINILGRATIMIVETSDFNVSHPCEFSDDDLNAMRRISNVMDVAPVVYQRNMMASNGKREIKIRLEGVDQSYWNTKSCTCKVGLLIGSDDESGSNATCVLGSDVTAELFGDSNPLGSTITISGLVFRVIGILGGIQDLETRATVYIPFSYARVRCSGMYPIKKVRIRVDHWGNVESVRDNILSFFKGKHMGQDRGIRIQHYPERIGKVKRTARMTRLLAIFAVATALAVGAVGSATLIRSSIQERTAEIGLKKAVGATETIITTQFIIEGALVSTCGGVIGCLTGVLVAAILHWGLNLDVDPVKLVGSSLFALILAAAIGVFCSFQAAWRAGRMDPVSALRFE
jgi:putative ABC transport system permease protein